MIMESSERIRIDKNFKVIVGCMTYNHSKYIVDALNGFAMQQTQFPFACIVIDDASTDGEPDVIKGWLQKECDMDKASCYDLELANVIIVPHRINVSCTMAVYFLKRNLYNEGDKKYNLIKEWGSHCEYIALCEGDDYWIDPEKLQIQSDFLDAHPEVDMCAHGNQRISAKNGRRLKDFLISKEDKVIEIKEIVGGYSLSLASLMYRVQLEYSMPAFRMEMNIDYTLCLHGALRGGIYYFCRLMSVYRVGVYKSWSYYMQNDADFYRSMMESFNRMYQILDWETQYEYHSIINRHILADNVSISRERKGNYKFSKDNFDIYKSLCFLDKLRVAAKCLLPSRIQLLISKLLDVFRT